MHYSVTLIAPLDTKKYAENTKIIFQLAHLLKSEFVGIQTRDDQQTLAHSFIACSSTQLRELTV